MKVRSLFDVVCQPVGNVCPGESAVWLVLVEPKRFAKWLTNIIHFLLSWLCMDELHGSID